MADESDDVFIISWNVAGFTSLHATVESQYSQFGDYLAQMKCDILCCQETKLQSASLCPGIDSSRCARAKGYTGYWAFNLNRPHSNGIVTWVSDRVPVLCATQNVLGIPEFDRDGRCLLTDHGAFIVINVYAKCVLMGAPPAATEQSFTAPRWSCAGSSMRPLS